MQIRRKSGSSNLWTGIRRTWPTMAAACQHSIRDGNSTLFWLHRWLDSGDWLADWVTHPISTTEMERTLGGTVAANDDWDYSLLNYLLPTNQLEQIAGMGTPESSSGDDDMIWGPDPRGKFSISSAYEILASTQNNSDQTLWKRVWKWQGPNRDWLCRIISDPNPDLACGIAMWLLWKARNEDIFEEVVGRSRDTLIRWIQAPDEWVMINTDGSVIQPLSCAASGGIIRNSHGAKLAAFTTNFGKCSITRVEL
ncbi:hypothetical protein LINPERHAP1_LOCUS29405 [Linum perenne]